MEEHELLDMIESEFMVAEEEEINQEPQYEIETINAQLEAVTKDTASTLLSLFDIIKEKRYDSIDISKINLSIDCDDFVRFLILLQNYEPYSSCVPNLPLWDNPVDIPDDQHSYYLISCLFSSILERYPEWNPNSILSHLAPKKININKHNALYFCYAISYLSPASFIRLMKYFTKLIIDNNDELFTLINIAFDKSNPTIITKIVNYLFKKELEEIGYDFLQAIVEKSLTKPAMKCATKLIQQNTIELDIDGSFIFELLENVISTFSSDLEDFQMDFIIEFFDNFILLNHLADVDLDRFVMVLVLILSKMSNENFVNIYMRTLTVLDENKASMILRSTVINKLIDSKELNMEIIEQIKQSGKF